jgi:hypothetical protein
MIGFNFSNSPVNRFCIINTRAIVDKIWKIQIFHGTDNFAYATQQIHVFECRIGNSITFTSKLIKNIEISSHVHLSLQRPYTTTVNITIIQNA